jgi:hypothetical protein
MNLLSFISWSSAVPRILVVDSKSSADRYLPVFSKFHGVERKMEHAANAEDLQKMLKRRYDCIVIWGSIDPMPADRDINGINWWTTCHYLYNIFNWNVVYWHTVTEPTRMIVQGLLHLKNAEIYTGPVLYMPYTSVPNLDGLENPRLVIASQDGLFEIPRGSGIPSHPFGYHPLDIRGTIHNCQEYYRWRSLQVV